MEKHIENAKNVLHHLTEHGHQAYFVGGYVRDFLMGLETSDIDIATSATPEEVTNLFAKVRPTGIRFGTVTVFIGSDSYEVTTFRSDGAYKNHRHPESVSYSTNLSDDLARRDYTINAMAMDESGTLIDEVGGKKDLDAGTIRAIGNPITRFEEDSLRILRAFRFVAKLGFDIEEKTFAAIKKSHPLLKRIANERILSELKQILGKPFSKKSFELMDLSGLTESFPELKQGLKILKDAETIPSKPSLFFSVLFRNNDPVIPVGWRFSKKEKDAIKEIVALSHLKENAGFEPIDLFEHGLSQCLDANATKRIYGLPAQTDASILELDLSLVLRDPGDLSIDGNDIVSEPGLKDPAQVKTILRNLLIKVLNRELPNDRKTLLNEIKQNL